MNMYCHQILTTCTRCLRGIQEFRIMPKFGHRRARSTEEGRCKGQRQQQRMTEIFRLKYFCVCLKQSAPLWWVLLLAGQLEHKSRILPVISFCLSPAESGIIVSLMVFKILTFLTTLLSPQISISFVLITLQILTGDICYDCPAFVQSIDRSTLRC